MSDITYIEEQIEKDIGNFDGYDVIDNNVLLHGWAKNVINNEKCRLIITNSQKRIITMSEINKERPDVRDYFNDENMLFSGWEVYVNIDMIKDNEFHLYAYVYCEKNGYAYKFADITEISNEKKLNNAHMFINYNFDDLIKRGLKVGKNFSLQPDCFIDYSYCWLISIGDDVTFAPRVHLIAHDSSTKRYLGRVKIGLIEIGNNVFIGNNTIVLMNVKVGANVIIGAGSVVTKDIPDNCVYAGNPAKFICKTSDYITKYTNLYKKSPVFSSDYIFENGISDDKKDEMVKSLKESVEGIGFV